MDLQDVELRSSGELISRLAHITLRRSDVAPYLGARIDLVTLMPNQLSPCQRYVLQPELQKVERLRWDVLEHTGHVDILKLSGYLKCHYEDGVIDIIPPVVEEFFTEDYRLILKLNDGMHRVYLAYQMGVPVTVAYVRGANPSFPYYSYATPEGWAGVQLIQELDSTYIKKFHVSPDHKKLYRSFNSQFENIGESRVRKV